MAILLIDSRFQAIIEQKTPDTNNKILPEKMAWDLLEVLSIRIILVYRLIEADMNTALKNAK